MIGIELMMACAPAVAPQTIQQIIHVESRGNELAINVNKGKLGRQPTDAADAAALAKEYIQKGYSVDLGLMQINSKNLAGLGYTVEDMFEPCKNLAAGARVLSTFYANARPKYETEQDALRAALSAYNTGNFINGFTNGYLALYGQSSGPVTLTRINPFTADSAVPFNLPTKGGIMPDTQHRTEQVKPVISQSEADAATPGVQVEYSAAEAERNGAFEETALSEADAWEANADLQAADPNGTGIIVNGKTVTRGGNKG